MRRSFAVIALCALTFAGWTSDPRYSFAGTFGEVVSDPHAACTNTFAQEEYQSVHSITGPTGRTVVSHFRNGEGGFFDQTTFVSNLGFNNDFLYEKTLVRNDIRYTVTLEGILDRAFVVIDAQVVALDAEGNQLCHATATYSGFDK